MAAKPIDCSELSLTIGKIALHYARQPGNASIDAIVQKVRQHFKELTRDEVVDSIIALQRSKPKRKPTEIQKQLAEVKKEARLDRATREQIDKLEKTLKGLPTDPDTPAARAKVSKALTELRGLRDRLGRDVRLDNRIKELERKIKARDTDTRPRPAGPKERIVAERDRLNKELAALRADKARRESLRESIDEMSRQLREGDIAIPEAKPKKPMDDEMTRLLFERDRIKAQIKQKIDDMNRSTLRKVVDNTFGFPKMILAGTDLSYVGRQGAISLATGRWKIAGRAFMEQFRAIKSDAAMARVTNEIMARPNAPLYRSAGLQISDQVEAMEGISEGLKKWTGAAFTDRAFAAAGNRMRADLFDTMYAGMGGNVTAAEAKHIADLVNNMTLRATMDARMAKRLNYFLFSARALKSRLAWLSMPVLPKGSIWGAPTWRSSRLAAKQYARFLVGVGTVWSAAHMLGVLGSSDPRSSDFLKLKFGESRVDVFGGLTSYMTFAARMATQQTVNKDGEVRALAGDDVPYGGREMHDVFFDFVKTKASPTASLVIDERRDKEFGGAPFDMRRALLSRAIPLSIQNAYELMQEEGLSKGSALSMLEVLGVSVYHHGEWGEGEKLPNDVIRFFGGEPRQR